MAEQPRVAHIINENLQDALDGISEPDYRMEHKLVADTLVPALRAIDGVSEVRDTDNGNFTVTFDSGQAARKLDSAIRELPALASDADPSRLTAISCLRIRGGGQCSHGIHLIVEQPHVAMQIAASLARASEATKSRRCEPVRTEADLQAVMGRMEDLGVKIYRTAKPKALEISYGESDAGTLAEAVVAFATHLHAVGVTFTRELHFCPQMLGTREIHACKTLMFHDAASLAAVARELERLVPALKADVRRKAL
jgi:hypothetical protein